MPIRYEIDRAKGLIRTTCWGEVRLQEVLAHFDELEDDPTRPSHLDVFLDLCGMTSPPRTPELQTAVDRIRRVSGLGFGLCAIVADRDVLFGIARMFEVFAEDHFEKVAVFRDAAEAEDWLRSKAKNPEDAE